MHDIEHVVVRDDAHQPALIVDALLGAGLDREADRAVSRAIGVFGPAALLALAGVFVLIAVAFYLPIFNLARAIAR